MQTTNPTNNRKPLIYYGLIVLVVMILLNSLVFPLSLIHI